MRKKLTKILCLVLPIVLVAAVVLGVCVKFGLKGRAEAEQIMPMSVSSLYDGQVVTSSDSTGSVTAAKAYKSGSVFLEPNSEFILDGGTITGHKNTYGGAVYVCSGATFTMTAGTISGNRATYGGAIYVEKGGKCYIQGGTIAKNKADQGPAIFVEAGGVCQISASATIANNHLNSEAPIIEVSDRKEKVGGVVDGVESTLELYTTTFGSYPQSYVGNAMNATLNTWVTSQTPVKTYVTRDDGVGYGTWKAYRYSDGNTYVQGASSVAVKDVTFKNGDVTPINGSYVWFKIEPIKWYILNYDAWVKGTDAVELLSEVTLTGAVIFNGDRSYGEIHNEWETSFIRTWCNSTFYKDAFTEDERSYILQTTVKNNETPDYANEDSDGKGPETKDYIYLKSFYEMSSGIFGGVDDETGIGHAARVCGASDFAISNKVIFTTETTTNPSEATYSYFRPDGISAYWLRSAGAAGNVACVVDSRMGAFVTYVISESAGVRPALKLDV